MSQYVKSQLRSGALGADEVDYLHPSRPFQWQPGGDCRDIRNGAKVDPDACEGSYSGWSKAQKAARADIAAATKMRAIAKSAAKSSQPAWLVPAAIAGGALLLLIALKK